MNYNLNQHGNRSKGGVWPTRSTRPFLNSAKVTNIASFLHWNSKVFLGMQPALGDLGNIFHFAALRGVSYEIGDFSQGFKIADVV